MNLFSSRLSKGFLILSLVLPLAGNQTALAELSSDVSILESEKTDVINLSQKRTSLQDNTLKGENFELLYDVPLIPQQTSMSCWAAGAAMLVAWRDQVSVNPRDVANAVGYWQQYNNGLHPEDTSIFPVLGMTAEPA